MSLRKRRIYFYVLCILFVFIIPPIMLYTSGYRLGPGLTLVETGGIYIYAPEPGSVIYIDGKERRTTTIFQREWFAQDITPGVYTVLIAKDEFWPWIKEVTVTEGQVSEAIAFLIPKEPETELIPKTVEVKMGAATTTKNNPAYAEALALFTQKKKIETSSPQKKPNTDIGTTTNNLPPDVVLEKISSHGRVGLVREENRIIAHWLKRPEDLPKYFCHAEICVSPTVVFSSIVPIRSFDFYPGRDDVLLVAVRDGIFAIEIDTRKTQNFQPIYRGVAPDFRFGDIGFIIKDGDMIARITL